MIMNHLELSIMNALASEGAKKEANEVYLEFLKANFLIPIEMNSGAEDPKVLYLEDRGIFFLPVFTNRVYLDAWAAEISDSIQLLSLSAVDLLKGIGENVIICLNIGSEIYKEFNAQELKRMRTMVNKLFK